MKRMVAIFLIVGSIAAGAQDAAKRAPAVPAAKPVAEQAAAVLSAEELAALRADVGRMQSLVEQMERNLGFVDNSLTPLKHQFQLEIEMWRVVAGQMERKLRRAEGRAKAK